MDLGFTPETPILPALVVAVLAAPVSERMEFGRTNMKQTPRVVSILAFALMGLAQQQPAKPKDSAKPTDPPKITSEMRETFFQAKADLLEAQAKLSDAQKRMEDAVKAMQSVCQLTLDGQGKPQCQAPAASTAPPEKK